MSNTYDSTETAMIMQCTTKKKTFYDISAKSYSNTPNFASKKYFRCLTLINFEFIIIF